MTRKFITDLFIAGEHFSFATMDEVVDAIFESGGLISSVHECEAPSICNDVTEEVAWRVCEALRVNGEELSSWQRDFIEQNIGLEAALAFPRAA